MLNLGLRLKSAICFSWVFFLIQYRTLKLLFSNDLKHAVRSLFLLLAKKKELVFASSFL